MMYNQFWQFWFYHDQQFCSGTLFKINVYWFIMEAILLVKSMREIIWQRKLRKISLFIRTFSVNWPNYAKSVILYIQNTENISYEISTTVISSKFIIIWNNSIRWKVCRPIYFFSAKYVCQQTCHKSLKVWYLW